MGFWDSLAEGTITGFMSGVGTMFKDVRTAITGQEIISSEERMDIVAKLDALEAQLAKYEHQITMGQLELNKIDAMSGSLFKSSWRPALGWACVLGVAYQFVFRPIGTWLIKVGFLIYAAMADGLTPALRVIMDEALKSPSLDMQTLLAILGTVLGVGAMRSYEKAKGVTL